MANALPHSLRHHDNPARSPILDAGVACAVFEEDCRELYSYPVDLAPVAPVGFGMFLRLCDTNLG